MYSDVIYNIFYSLFMHNVIYIINAIFIKSMTVKIQVSLKLDIEDR